MPERLRRWTDRRPLLWLAGVGIGAVVFADGTLWLGLVILALLFAGTFIAKAPRLGLAACGVACVSGWFHESDVSQRRTSREGIGRGQAVEFELKILEAPRAAGRGWAALAEVREGGGRVMLKALGLPAVKGSLVRARGWLRPPSAPRNPGEFDQRRWLDRRGVFGVLEAGVGVKELAPAPRWRLFGDGVRAGFRESVTRGLDPLSEEAAVIRAVVLGERPGDDMLIEPFRLTGTLHVFAVSGLHVGMVGLLGWFAMRLFGVPRRMALIPLALMMFGYAWLTGMKPPAVRAAWMAAVVLGAFWFRRRPDVANALGLAALLVVLSDGDLLFTVGVQLSFGVVAAIGLLHPVISPAFRWMERTELYLPRSLYGPWRERWLKIRQWASGLFAVSTSAWLGSAPWTAWYFGIVTPISIIASVLLSLVVLPLLGISLMAAACAPLPLASETLNTLNARLAGVVLSVAKLGAATPGGHFSVPRDRPGDEFLLVFDVTDDGAAVWHGEGETVLIDGGSRYSFERSVLPSLRRMALRPSSIVATHPDGGHVGGLIEALDAFPVRRGLAPVHKALGPNYRTLLESAESRGVSMILGEKAVAYSLTEHAALEVVHEPDPWNLHDLADGRVMPVRLTWRGWKILFVSDGGWAMERAMLKSGVDFQADVIVAGRHARDLTLGSGFLDATGAKVVIATHAKFPSEQRIPESWRAACERRGIGVFHQGESGAVSVTTDENVMTLRGFIDGRVIELVR